MRFLCIISSYTSNLAAEIRGTGKSVADGYNEQPLRCAEDDGGGQARPLCDHGHSQRPNVVSQRLALAARLMSLAIHLAS